MMKKCEASEQMALFQWASIIKNQHPELSLLFHIPNGGSRNSLEAANLKRQGVKAGVPDIFLPVARGNYHGLFIELKYGKNKPTDKQLEWHNSLTTEGYKVAVCYGFESARQEIEDYINDNSN